MNDTKLLNILILIGIATGIASETIKSLEIQFRKNADEMFPNVFEVRIDRQSLEFIKVQNDENYPLGSANIYTIDSSKKVAMFRPRINKEVAKSYFFRSKYLFSMLSVQVQNLLGHKKASTTTKIIYFSKK